MEYKKFDNTFVIRIDKGEEVIEMLTKLCEKENIKLASVSGIGATNKAMIGLFDTKTKIYHKTELKGDYEITNLAGNISTMNEKTYLHLHVNLADDKNMTYGGHLNSLVISGTGEIIVHAIKGEIDRAFNKEIGLNLFKF